MKFVQRTMMGFGGLVLAAVLISLAVPQVAHGLVAALVQVVNTAAAPAITQDVSKLAAQNMSFLSSPNLTDTLHVRGKDGVLGSPFTVPAGQTLIITSVNFFPDSAFNFAPAVILRDFSNLSSQYAIWWAPAGVTAAGAVSSQFTYPVGIAIQAGITPAVSISQPGFSGILEVELHGYLTSN
jgi:hypothetical protein